MLGPVMEIELVSPLDVVPKDTEIGVKHFLTVPEKTYFENAIYQEDKTHRVVKLTKGNSGFEIEHIDTKCKVSSEYFRTKNFVGKSFCHVTTTAGIENHECLHASVKKFYVTERQDLCPHLKFNLKVFCVCKAVEEHFRDELRDQDHKLGTVNIKHDIKKDMDTSYSLDIKVQEGEWKELDQRISHKELCR